jgi:plasmid stabilization system protein ParE
MSTRRVIFSRRALTDLDDIWTYLANEASPATAGRVIGDILDAVDRLAEIPGMGHERADVRDPAYRFWSVKGYVIGYRPDASALYVARVVHGRRNLGHLFR